MSWWRGVARRRKQDFIVGGDQEQPYMLRWFLIPRNKLFNAYLHKFMRPDQDEEMHDHPWLFNISIMLEGSYVEETVARGGVHHKRTFRPGQFKIRLGPAPHRVCELPSGECWTLFITGPVVRTWGFHCPAGWKPFREFIEKRKSGAGCS